MKNISLTLLFLLTLVACDTMTFTDEDTTTQTKGEKKMYFRCTGFNMTEYGEMTKSSSNQEYTDHILLGIFDSNGNPVSEIIYQHKDDTSISYGSFTHTLKYGTYTILTLGWNGGQQCIVKDLENITFSEGWVPHTFLCRKNIVVSEAYSDTRTLSLKRCVAKFTLKCLDKSIPKETAAFTFRFSKAGKTLNSETQHCTKTEDFERTIETNGKINTPLSINTYCFLPGDSTSVEIGVSAYDKAGNLLGERTILDVPMRINYSTTYSGNFFPIGDVNSSVSFEHEFDGEINCEF